MKNYICSKIVPKNELPRDNDSKQFLSLSEYLKIAERVIKYFGPKMTTHGMVASMLSSEDAISEVAYYIMKADWTYNIEKSKGKTPYTYRNYMGRRGIQRYIANYAAKKNQNQMSLNDATFVEDGSETPLSLAMTADRLDRLKQYLPQLISESNLSQVQKDCICLYLEGKNYAEIGQSLEPPVTRQGVQQNMKRAIHKLRYTLGGAIL